MRGALPSGHHVLGGSGIIPADAGSTPIRPSRPWRERDHPRGCGEHIFPYVNAISQRGSSPRMRGAPFLFAAQTLSMRIIPADAGSTPREVVIVGDIGDHPRGCGEHLRGSAPFSSICGSSPRMRGALDTRDFGRFRTRIIPADAGSTFLSMIGIAKSADHPRGCGEHLLAYLHSSRTWGSSPRMRGALVPGKQCGPIPRIIPADAGSTRPSR